MLGPPPTRLHQASMKPETSTPPTRVAIAGARGFVGSALAAHFTSLGHVVVRIGRGSSRDGVDVEWDPAAGRLDAALLQGVEAVLNVAGERIDQSWSPAAKRRILDSRVQSTVLLARTCAAMDPKPRVLVNMSAVGIYGDRGDEPADEAAAPGTGFLADVVRAWEEAADPAREAGVRVVHPRAGTVMHPAGGALARLVPIYRMGGGGAVGSGRQWMSWIARTDLVRALAWLAVESTLGGAVNVVSPEPVRNAEFGRILASVLHRPALINAPAFAVRMLYGEMGQETVLAGQRVVSRRLTEAGFRFEYPDLRSALAHEIGLAA